MTWSTGEDQPTDLASAQVVVDLEPPGAGRDRQLASLRSSCSSGSSVSVRHRRATPWLDAFLHMAAVFHGPGWAAEPSEDEQQAFMQVATALAPTGADWSWRSA